MKWKQHITTYGELTWKKEERSEMRNLTLYLKEQGKKNLNIVKKKKNRSSKHLNRIKIRKKTEEINETVCF